MSLQAKLDAYKADFMKRATADALAVMREATESLAASGILDGVIGVGDALPEFELKNQDGQAVRSEELLREGPLVLSFFRGIWCPYCNIELEALNAANPAILDAGARLITIAPQTENWAHKNRLDRNLDFDILVDEGNRYASQLGLVFSLPKALIEVYTNFGLELPTYNGDESWTLPLPARLVVDSSHRVAYASVNADYTIRPEPDEVIAALVAL